MDEDIDLCPDCLEHCEATEDYEYEAARKEAWEEMIRDGEKDEF